MEKRIYPTIPTAPPEDNGGSTFNSYSARSKFEDLKKKKEYLEKKRKNYNKKLDITILVNRIASGLGVTSAGVSVATGVTFVGIPVAIGSGLFGVLSACVSLVSSALNKKYKKKLEGNNQMQDILSQGMVLFEKALGKSLANDDVIDQEELNELTAIYVNLIGEMVRFDRKNSAEMRKELENTLFEEIRKIKARQERM